MVSPIGKNDGVPQFDGGGVDKTKSQNSTSTPAQNIFPPKIGENGIEDEHINYIIDKLIENGHNIDFDTLADVIARYDYDIDADGDSTIQKKEIESYQYLEKYMNKDSKGNIKDTHALDMLYNQYLAEINKNADAEPKPNERELLASIPKEDQELYNQAISNPNNMQLVYEAKRAFIGKAKDPNDAYAQLTSNLEKLNEKFLFNALDFFDARPQVEKNAISQVLSNFMDLPKGQARIDAINDAIKVLDKYPNNQNAQYLKLWVSEFMSDIDL